MKAVLMAFVMTIRASSDIWVPRCFPLKAYHGFRLVRWLNAPCASIAVVSAKTDRYRFCYISRGLFDAIERDGDYGSSAVLKPPRDQPF